MDKIKVLIFDFKRDYAGLVKLCKNIIIVRWEDLKFNLLAPPKNTKPLSWIQIFCDVFSEVFGLMHGSNFYLQQHVFNLFRDFGIFDGSTNYPTMMALYERISKAKETSRVVQDYLMRIKNRVYELVTFMGPVLDCSYYPVEEFLEKNIVIEMDGLAYSLQRCLITLLLMNFFTYRINTNLRFNAVQNLMVIDECKLLFGKDVEIQSLVKLSSQIAEFGFALLIADQIPSFIRDEIKANMGTVFCFRLAHGKDIADISRMMGLSSKEQAEAIHNLKVGEAIVRTI